MFACPLFREFHGLNKTAKLKGVWLEHAWICALYKFHNNNKVDVLHVRLTDLHAAHQNLPFPPNRTLPLKQYQYQTWPSSVKGGRHMSPQNLPKIVVVGHRKPTQWTHLDEICHVSLLLPLPCLPSFTLSIPSPSYLPSPHMTSDIWFCNNFAAGSFHMKKLYSRLRHRLNCMYKNGKFTF